MVLRISGFTDFIHPNRTQLFEIWIYFCPRVIMFGGTNLGGSVRNSQSLEAIAFWRFKLSICLPILSPEDVNRSQQSSFRNVFSYGYQRIEKFGNTVILTKNTPLHLSHNGRVHRHLGGNCMNMVWDLMIYGSSWIGQAKEENKLTLKD
jgi:hypothetical protein